jgi:hypothetical protein
MGWPCFGRWELAIRMAGASFSAPSMRRARGPTAGLRGALGQRVGAGMLGGGERGVREREGCRRAGAGSFVAVVPRLGVGRTRLQRGREAMQLFPLRGA